MVRAESWAWRRVARSVEESRERYATVTQGLKPDVHACLRYGDGVWKKELSGGLHNVVCVYI